MQRQDSERRRSATSLLEIVPEAGEYDVVGIDEAEFDHVHEPTTDARPNGLKTPR